MLPVSVEDAQPLMPPAPPPMEMSISRPVYSYAEFNDLYGESVRRQRSLSKLARDAAACDCSRERWLQRLRNLVPLVSLFRSGKYRRTDFISDVIAGITTFVFHIPQGLAYGLLASLKPINGLYTSLIPVFIFSIFARSQHLAIGTFALMSLLLSDMIIGNYEAYLPRITSNASLPLNYTSVEYAKLQTAIVGTFAASVTIMMIGVMRFGFLMRYVSEAMLKGFTTGAAVQVIVSQLPLMMGVTLKQTNRQFRVFATFINISKVIQGANLVTVGISAASFVVLYLVREFVSPLMMKKTKVPLPIELIIVVVSLLASEFTNLNATFKVAIVGEVPRGLPSPIVPDFGFLPNVLPSAITIGIVGSFLTMALGKVYCLRFRYKYDFNEDFLVLGLSSLVSSFFQCYLPCSALARNAVVVSVGMKTQVAGLVSCLGMLLVLLVVGPYFRSIPVCVLGTIIVVSLIRNLLQVLELPKIWRISRIDFCVWVVSALAVAVLDVSFGLAIGVGFTMFTIVVRTQSARIAILGQVGDTDVYQNILAYSAAKELPGIKIICFDAPLNFTNVERFEDFVIKLASRMKSDKPEPGVTPVHTIVLDCSSWVYVDLYGVKTAKETFFSLRSIGYRVLFASCKESVRVHFSLQDFQEVDRSLFFVSLHDAVLFARRVPPSLTPDSQQVDPICPASLLTDDIEDVSGATKF